MTRHNIPIGRILGIPIGLDYSWFVIFGLITWMLAVSYYPAEFKDWSLLLYWFMGAVTAVMLFVSVLLHELGHSVVALRYKIPVRNITLFLFGGVAQIGGESPNAMAEFVIASAGPFVSLVLALFFYLVQPMVAGLEPLLGLAKYLAYINLALVIFNLIPGFPLDGGRVFRAIVWSITGNFHRATLIAANVGRLFAFLFIFVGVWQMFSGNFGGGLWIAFIGWFLDNRGNDIVGLMTLHQIKEVPRPEWTTTNAGQAMLPMDQLKHIDPDTELWAIFPAIPSAGSFPIPFQNGSNLFWRHRWCCGPACRFSSAAGSRWMERLQKAAARLTSRC